MFLADGSAAAICGFPILCTCLYTLIYLRKMHMFIYFYFCRHAFRSRQFSFLLYVYITMHIKFFLKCTYLYIHKNIYDIFCGQQFIRILYILPYALFDFLFIYFMHTYISIFYFFFMHTLPYLFLICRQYY